MMERADLLALDELLGDLLYALIARGHSTIDRNAVAHVRGVVTRLLEETTP